MNRGESLSMPTSTQATFHSMMILATRRVPTSTVYVCLAMKCGVVTVDIHKNARAYAFSSFLSRQLHS